MLRDVSCPYDWNLHLNKNTPERLWFSLYKNKSAKKSMGKINDAMPKMHEPKRKRAKGHDAKYKKMRENKGHSDACPSEKMGAKTPASENKPILSEALSKQERKSCPKGVQTQK
jgi:hypothetical protein